MSTRVFLALALSALLVLSCGDDITNNYYTNTLGAVFGNVVPVDSGTALLHGLTEMQSPIDANGFFNFANVEPGTYTLELKPLNHGRRQLSDVVVGTGVTAQFRETTISEHPYPVFLTSPRDGATSVYTGTSIRITCDEQLNLNDLNSLTAFDPSLEGHWSPYDDYYGDFPEGNSYNFQPSSNLLPDTEYRMTIDRNVRTESGTFDEDLQLTFTTREFRAYFRFEKNGRTGRVSRRGFRATIGVYLCVSSDTMATAVQFEPDIPGIWVLSEFHRCAEPDQARQHDFLAFDLPLLPKTTYTVIVRAEPFGLVAADSATFETEGYEVIEVLPRNGYYGVPYDNEVLVIFNEPMDTVSARLAFSVTKVGGEEVPGTFTWNSQRTEMTYGHWDNLYTVGSYIIEVTTEAKTEEGENLDVGWESSFQVL